MLNPSQMPNILMLLKKSTTGNPLIKIGKEDVFFAFTNKAVEDVVLNKYSSFEKSGGLNRLKYLLGEGLITSEEPKHMYNKKEISPAFKHSHMADYETRISAIVDSVLSKWSGQVNAREQMSLVVFKSVLEIFFSESMDENIPQLRDNTFIATGKLASAEYDEELERSVKELRELSKQIVDKRLASKEEKHDFLGILINSYNNGKINLEDVYDEAITILLVSYETTIYSLETTLYYLSINKDWQEKVSEDEYANAFINEVLRISPPIWYEERVAMEDVIIDGKEIPAGTQVVVSSLAVHRNKDVFEDPDSFKPERWFDNKELQKGEYFPFLFGKRQCIGKEFALMEMRIVVTKIAKKFRLELVNTEVSKTVSISYRPSEEIIINVRDK